MDECKPLTVGSTQFDETEKGERADRHTLHRGRGLHSFTSQLNLSAVYVIGGARRDYVARVKGVLEGV